MSQENACSFVARMKADAEFRKTITQARDLEDLESRLLFSGAHACILQSESTFFIKRPSICIVIANG